MTQEQRIEALEQQVSEMEKQLTEIKQSVSCDGELYSENITGSLLAPEYFGGTVSAIAP
ncbi:hypothetical protein [Yersinia rochesterensis]|uniref:hypothetical protein n=1 Tax=Yersinia rochesterensis TaxID=1604335 RepID=UPI0013C4D06B|nr:hypothetical protein [Yersinia rochesterensis]